MIKINNSYFKIEIIESIIFVQDDDGSNTLCVVLNKPFIDNYNKYIVKGLTKQQAYRLSNEIDEQLRG